MILRVALIAALLLFVATDAGAQQNQPSRVVFGEGGSSCGQWTQARQNPSAKQGAMAQWIVGFLSGRNLDSTNDFLSGTDFDGVTGWFDNYCKAHPLDSLTKAASELTDELRARAQ